MSEPIIDGVPAALRVDYAELSKPSGQSTHTTLADYWAGIPRCQPVWEQHVHSFDYTSGSSRTGVCMRCGWDNGLTFTEWLES